MAPYATADDILGTFQDERYRGRVAIFHYAGHAESYELLLQGANGKPAVADAGGLALSSATKLACSWSSSTAARPSPRCRACSMRASP